MSLMDKTVNFDSTYSGLAKAIYNIIKPIFKDAILDNTTVYFDSNKQDGFRMEDYNLTSSSITIVYIIQNNQYRYMYRGSSISNFSTIYYNISANKDIIAFSLKPGILDLGIGYEEKIGFWGLFIGDMINTTDSVPDPAYLFITDTTLCKYQAGVSGSNRNRWIASSANVNITLAQLPLFVVSGNFNSLFEVVSNYKNYNFNLYSVIYSNNKYYRLIQSYQTDYSLDGSVNSVILAMEVADD